MKTTDNYIANIGDKVTIDYSHKGKHFRQTLKIAYKDKDLKKNALIINPKVDRLKEIINEYNKKNNTNPPIEYVKERYFTTELNKSDIIELFDNFVKDIEMSKKTNLKKKTKIKSQSIFPYKHLKNNINDYILEKKYSIVDEKFVEDFYVYVASKRYSYSLDTIRKKSIYFNAFLNYLKMKEVIKFEITPPSSDKGPKNKKVITLSDNELNYLMDERKNNSEYKVILDMFLFQCFTSLRYSDLVQISRTKVNNNKIELISVKTEMPIIIYTNQLLNQILIDNNYNFTQISYQTYRTSLNAMLKEFAEKITSLKEIVYITKYIEGKPKDIPKFKYELMGTHTGRRTFITIQIRMNTSFADIMAMTGHKSLELLQEYLDIYNQENQGIENNLSEKMLNRLNNLKK